MADSDESTKLTLRLSPSARAVIEELSKKNGGITASEVIRRALSTELFIMREQEKDSKVIIEGSSGSQKQVVFR